MNPRLEVFDDAEAASRRGAEVSGGSARSCAAAGRRFAFAMSGGGTPWRMFAIVAEMDVPWASVDLFQVDERIAPDGDPDRSLTHIRGALLPAADAARWHPMGVTAPDPEALRALFTRMGFPTPGSSPSGSTWSTWALGLTGTRRRSSPGIGSWMCATEMSRSPGSTKAGDGSR